jgi:hypothetical protein
MLKHWCQYINKCWNIGPKGCKLASQIWRYPCFKPWGQYKGHKSSAFISNLGHIEKVFSISALTPSVKPLGADFNFVSPSRNAYLIWVEHLPWLLVYSGPKTNTLCQNINPSQLVKDTLCHESFLRNENCPLQ